jgi:hypothetical protein
VQVNTGVIMSIENDEVLRRKTSALSAIKKTFGTEVGEFGANLFVSHHLDELDGDYWLKHLGTEKPDGVRVLDLLTLRSHWGDDEVGGEKGIEVFDFTLPDDITDYVISVRFDDAGEIDEISVES